VAAPWSAVFRRGASVIDTVALRYALVGVANTLLGFGCILALQQGLGIAPLFANAAGFALGLLLSYSLNRRFAFRSTRAHASAFPAFLFCAGASFGLNVLVLQCARIWAGLPDQLAQGLAVGSYVVGFYLLNRYVVFNPSRG
jgi:putative flippase GtrA